MTDPFPVPADEAQTQPGGSVNVESDGVEVTVTVKSSPGYDAPWTVVRGPMDAVAARIGAQVRGEHAKLSEILAQVPALTKYAQEKYSEGGPGKA